jgi:hypothetical protein
MSVDSLWGGECPEGRRIRVEWHVGRTEVEEDGEEEKQKKVMTKQKKVMTLHLIRKWTMQA